MSATRPVDELAQRVTPLELFFDLMFVFAITQVTGFIAANPTWTRLALIPLAGAVRPRIALGLVAAVTAALIAYETLRYAAARDRIRHA